MKTATMKILQTVQTNLAVLGFERNLRPFNKRQMFWFFEGLLSSTTFVIYLLFEASSPKEYMDSIFMIVIGTLMTISHFSMILETETIFVLIDKIENIINASEF